MGINIQILLKMFRACIFMLAFIFTTNSSAFSGDRDNRDRDDRDRDNRDRDDRDRDDRDRDDDDDHNGNNPGSDSIPLDGGLGILVLGAAAFGIKKLRNT